VYEYDALTGALVRVSVGNEGFNSDGNAGEGGASIAPVSNVTLAGSVPVRSDPTMSDDGAFVFFESPVALAPAALNDFPIGLGRLAQNVYEYHEGHVFLISDGKDTSGLPLLALTPVELLGSDRSGANVFFATFDRLVPEDSDTSRDYYDAHICSEAEPCPAPAPAPLEPCGGEACHGTAPTQSATPTPASQSFSGPGDLAPPPLAKPAVPTAAEIRAAKLASALKACRKHKRKSVRVSCERQAKKRYGTASKASHKSKRRGR
jgi:hypothetical protein